MKVDLLGAGWALPADGGTGKRARAFAFASRRPAEGATRIRLDPPYPRLARMNPVSRVALAALVGAMKTAGLASWRRKRDIGIVAATRTGCLNTDMDYFKEILAQGGASASPHLFAYTLPSAFMGDASIYLGLVGPAFVIQEEDPFSLTGLTLAVDLLFMGDARFMGVGAWDDGLGGPFGSGKDSGPHALFMVIGKADENRTGHGPIQMTRGDAVLFRGKPVMSLVDIFRAYAPPFHGDWRGRSGNP